MKDCKYPKGVAGLSMQKKNALGMGANKPPVTSVKKGAVAKGKKKGK